MKVNHKTREYFATARMLKALGVELSVRHKGQKIPLRYMVAGPKKGREDTVPTVS